jgi:hypothetical protein
MHSVCKHNVPSCSIHITQSSRSIENPIALEKERSILVALQDNALLLLLLLGQESGACGVFENLTDTLICLCGTLKILVGANLLANLLTLWFTVSHNSTSSNPQRIFHMRLNRG